MITIKKEIKNYDEFEKYIGSYCGPYPDYTINRLLNNLTLNSLLLAYSHLKINSNSQNLIRLSNYYINLLTHVNETLKKEYEVTSPIITNFY